MNKSHIIFWVVVIALFGWFVSAISSILLPFVVGMGVAYMLDPLADKLECKGLSRTTATSIISGGFFAIIVLLLVVIIPIITEQLGGLIESTPKYFNMLQQNYPKYLQKISTKLHFKPDDDAIISSMIKYAQSQSLGVLKNIVQSGFMLVNFMGLMLITPLVSFYLLRDWDKVVERIGDLLPPKYAPIICEQMQAIDATMAAFMRGTVNIMLVLLVYYAVALWLIGLPYSLLIAVLAGVLIIIPMIGTFVSAGVALSVSFVHFDDMQKLLLVGAVFAVGQVLEGYVLTPRLVGKHVGLNPLWLIFAMMAGGAVLGFVGVLIAVPLAAVLGVLLRFAISQYKNSEVYRGG